MIKATMHLDMKPALSALALFLPLCFASAAHAASSCDELTCPKGFACELESAACPDIACVEGPCQPCAAEAHAVCRSAVCATDGDCGADMLCVESTNSATTGPAECAGGDCAEAPAEDPVTGRSSEKRCTPRWTLACNADADCGAGFECQACSCAGASTPGSSGPGSSSAAAAPSAADAAPAPTPPDGCGCGPTTPKTCVARVVACSTDADCVSGWTCRDNPNGACWANSNGETGCTPADPAKLCAPPYSGVSSGDFGGTPTNAEGTAANGGVDHAVDAVLPDDDGGCSVSSRRGSAGGGGLLSLIAVALAAMGWRRRERS
jgi:hypothetical protein